MIRVLSVEDHRSNYESLALVLRPIDDIELVGHCSSADQVVPMALETNSDVVLMNMIMPRQRGSDEVAICGLEVAQELLTDLPGIQVLIVSALARQRFADRAREMGVAGYLPKGMPRDDLITIIRVVALGGTAWAWAPN